MGKFFNWPPFVAVPIDADTGKPLDPNVGMRVKREFYNVGTDGKGKKVMIAHKSGSAAAEGGNKEGGGTKQTNNAKEKRADAGGAGWAGQKVSCLLHLLTYSILFSNCFIYNTLTT